MMTPQIMKALSKAIVLHKGQKRKDGVTPFIVHPISVGMILTEQNATEEQVIAGVLHDTLEDTVYTYEELRSDFGVRVARMVLACSEDQSIENWNHRKEELLGRLQKEDSAKIVKAADALSNMMDLHDSTKRFGESFWLNFQNDKRSRMQYYIDIYDIAEKHIPDGLRSDYHTMVVKLSAQVKVHN